MHLFNFNKIKYDPLNKGYLAILENSVTNTKLSILIGSNEAQSLSLAHENVKLPRPRTNELIINLISKINGTFDSIIINKYEKGVFYSIIKIKFLDTLIELDSRPSDAIEIAIKENLPIYIIDEVLKIVNNKNTIENENLNEEFDLPEQSIDEMKNKLIDALNKSIIEENYEIAAKLRDRIKKLDTKKI